ncbi:MAG: RdgB/HAM1 family non-canonical purine NTP pyrophosphatase [Bacteroidota bacterium]|nr:RdgB/HAM1 family non-canonical purine NTP pyrophosphatase [Bacteroidota bacterium]
MNTIIFATNNKNKVDEVRSILDQKFKILSLKEAGIEIDIPEPHDSLEENACEKARVIHNLTQKDCFAEDTGLEVESLNGEPGVKSARYAGEDRSFENNIDKLLTKLAEKENRHAQFRTIICLICNGEEKIFEGICKGIIIADRRGISGFGYDPVFIPEGSTKTFAEMSMPEKNIFSHRKKAMEKLTAYLKK